MKRLFEIGSARPFLCYTIDWTDEPVDIERLGLGSLNGYDLVPLEEPRVKKIERLSEVILTLHPDFRMEDAPGWEYECRAAPKPQPACLCGWVEMNAGKDFIGRS